MSDLGKASASPSGAASKLARRLFESVDGVSLAFFRVAFGLVMVWEMWRYFSYG